MRTLVAWPLILTVSVRFAPVATLFGETERDENERVPALVVEDVVLAADCAAARSDVSCEFLAVRSVIEASALARRACRSARVPLASSLCDVSWLLSLLISEARPAPCTNMIVSPMPSPTSRDTTTQPQNLFESIRM